MLDRFRHILAAIGAAWLVICGAALIKTYNAQSQRPTASPSEASQTVLSQSASQGSISDSSNQPVPRPSALTEQPANNPNRRPGPQDGQAALNAWFMDSNWIIAIFTVVIAVYSILTWRTYRAILHTNQIVERAWIGLEDMAITNFEPGHDPGVIVVLKNSGHTPATLKTVRLKLEIIDAGIALPQPPDYGPDLGRSAPAVLMAGEVASARLSPSINAPIDLFHYNGVQNGVARLYIYGAIEYVDTFDMNKIRTYGFARQFDPGLSQTHGRSMFLYPQVPGYNYAT